LEAVLLVIPSSTGVFKVAGIASLLSSSIWIISSVFDTNCTLVGSKELEASVGDIDGTVELALTLLNVV
jgi:hypothetical protein